VREVRSTDAAQFRPDGGPLANGGGRGLRRFDHVEILPINDAFCTDSVIRTVNAIQAKNGLRGLTSVSA